LVIFREDSPAQHLSKGLLKILIAENPGHKKSPPDVSDGHFILKKITSFS
jgi:hypothetical protein